MWTSGRVKSMPNSPMGTAAYPITVFSTSNGSPCDEKTNRRVVVEFGEEEAKDKAPYRRRYSNHQRNEEEEDAKKPVQPLLGAASRRLIVIVRGWIQVQDGKLESWAARRRQLGASEVPVPSKMNRVWRQNSMTWVWRECPR